MARGIKGPSLAFGSMVAVAALVMGCHDGDERNRAEKREVARVAQGYVDALTAGDVKRACTYENLPLDICLKFHRDGRELGTGFGKLRSVCLGDGSAVAYFKGGAFLVLGKSFFRGWTLGGNEDALGSCPTI